MNHASVDKSKNCSVVQIAEELRSNLFEASHRLTKTPGFTMGSVLILALAIGASTLVFTFLTAYVLKPLPLIDPRRNVEITARQSNGQRFDVWS